MKSTADAKRPGKGWLSRQEFAAVLDISTQQFDGAYRRYVDPAAQKNVNGKLYFHARSLLDKWKEHGAAPKATGEADPMLVGPESDALEFYRKQRGLQEEIKLEQMRGNTVAIVDIEPPLLNLCGMLRRAGETLARQFGNDAAQVLNEAVDEFKKGVESVLSNGRGSPTTDTSPV